MEREIIIATFFDEEGEKCSFMIKTELTEKQFQFKVGDIINKWLDEDYIDWYDDEIIEELNKDDEIEIIPTKKNYSVRI